MRVPAPLFLSLRYGLAVTAVLIALLLTAWLQPLLDRSLFLVFFLAVVTTAWYAGIGPALLSVGLSGIACEYLLIHPVSIIVTDQSLVLLRLLIFVSVSLIMCVLIFARKQMER